MRDQTFRIKFISGTFCKIYYYTRATKRIFSNYKENGALNYFINFRRYMGFEWIFEIQREFWGLREEFGDSEGNSGIERRI